MQISLCMIVKNEEENLPNCLESVKDLVDEINIIDTGSTDKTVEIAKKYTDRIFFFDWIDDFSAARNFSFEKATKDYIMWLDADDIIDEENLEKLLRLKKSFKGHADCITLNYIISADNEGNPALVALRERIVRNNAGYKWRRSVHEQLKGGGITINWDAAITHTKKHDDSFVGRNLRILEKAVDSPNAEPLDNYYYGIILSNTGNYAEAVKQLNLFIKNNKDASFTGIDAFVSIYNSYIALGDYENAYKILAENEKVNRDKSEYYCLLGYFMMNYLKDYDLALGYFKRALNCTGKEGNLIFSLQRYEEYYYFKPWNYIGQCYLKMGKYNDALEAFKNALNFNDNEAVRKIVCKLEGIKM